MTSSELPPNSVVLGDADGRTLLPYARQAVAMVDRLRAAGIEPSRIALPSGGAHANDPLLTMFYGVPVVWVPGADRVQVLVDVPGWSAFRR